MGGLVSPVSSGIKLSPYASGKSDSSVPRMDAVFADPIWPFHNGHIVHLRPHQHRTNPTMEYFQPEGRLHSPKPDAKNTGSINYYDINDLVDNSCGKRYYCFIEGVVKLVDTILLVSVLTKGVYQRIYRMVVRVRIPSPLPESRPPLQGGGFFLWLFTQVRSLPLRSTIVCRIPRLGRYRTGSSEAHPHQYSGSGPRYSRRPGPWR